MDNKKALEMSKELSMLATLHEEALITDEEYETILKDIKRDYVDNTNTEKTID